MKLNLSKIIDVPGGRIPFEFALDLSDLELNFQHPVKNPLQVHGAVENAAGVLTLTAVLETTLSLVCDRCAAAFTQEKKLDIKAILADKPQDSENDDFFPLEGDSIDVSEIAVSAFVLDMEMKILCRPDCKGLCPKCGKNLNDGDCGCSKKEIDPRLAGLKKLLQ